MPGGHQRLTESADEKGAATSPKNRQLSPPPLRHAKGRLVLCGHAPALAAGEKAACPVRPRTRPCGTQEGGSSRPATHPPLRHARRRLVLCGHAPALAARKRAARPVRPRTRPCGTQEGGSSCAATDRLVLCGHAPLTCLRRILQTPGLQSPR